jgi:Family of unknown function (DUF6320)
MIMPYCPKCGVEVESNRPACPLCSFPIPFVDEPKKNPIEREQYLLNRYRLKQAENKKRWKEARIFVYSGISVSLILLSIIFGILDFYSSGKLGWSLYVITSNLAVVVFLFFLLRFIQGFLPNFLGLGFTAAGLLYILDNLNGKIDWFWDLGLVICINTLIWSLILRYIIRHSRRRGLNIPAYSLFATALASLSLQIIGNLYKGESIHLTWSIPVITLLVPIGGLFLFMHLLLSQGVREKLKRKFHL